MNRTYILLASLLLIATSQQALSQQITEPGMTVQSFSDAELVTPPDGRIVRRVNAATVGLIFVEWPKGTKAPVHNHANELVLAVVEGSLRAMSGGEEFLLEAGDVVIIPAWVEHGYEALEDSVTYEAAGPG